MAARKSPRKTTGGEKSARSGSTKQATSSKPKAGVGKKSVVAAPKTVKKATKAKEKPAKEDSSSMSVNLGHVFSLRPRVRTSFRQGHFEEARRLLQEERYASIQEAARAVATKALELTHEGPSKRDFKSRR